jgi:hypothetical protein
MNALQLLLPIALTALVFTSCTDNCQDKGCLNGSVCDDGACTCVAGFEGEVCEHRERDKFLGRYNVTYRGTVVDGNSFGDNTTHAIDQTVLRTLTADAPNDGVVVPDFLLKTGQNMYGTVSEDVLQLLTGEYIIQVNDTAAYTFNLFSLSHFYYSANGTMRIRIQASNLAEGTSLDVDVILTKLN